MAQSVPTAHNIERDAAPDSLETVLERCAAPETDALPAAQALIAAIRPRRPGNGESPTRAIRAICHLLTSRPELRQRVRSGLIEFLSGKQSIPLFTDSGLYPNHGFFDEVGRRIGRTLLPEDIDDQTLRGVISAVFDRTSDARWVAAVDEAVWQELFVALKFSELGEDSGKRLMYDLLEALRVISYRITATALEPEFLRHDAFLQTHSSPFLAQNVELLNLLNDWHRWLEEPAEELTDSSHLGVLFDQAREVIARVRSRASREGTSLSLTLHIRRLQQNIARAECIIQIIAAWRSGRTLDAAAAPLMGFCKTLVVDECRKNDLRSYWRDSVELLSKRVTDNAGRAGEHYITETRAEYFAMFRSAAVAGFFIALMALNKLFIGAAHLPPLVEALSVCLNYGVGFVLIHLVHGTVATKQPAMTAAAIAAALGDGRAGSRKARDQSLDRLTGLIARTVRSQLVAILGNVMVAVPLSMLIGFALTQNLGAPYPSPEKASHLLHDIHPWRSGAVLFAGIAGICLFLSGLIAGYYDNITAYNRIPQRLLALKWPRWLFGEERMRRTVIYIENNLGALAGNFFFGFLLGGVATFGILFGLPIDIRHIAFSSAFVGYSANSMDFVLSAHEILVCALGIAAIGAANLAVSFSLSLWVACRSREVSLSEWAVIRHRVWLLLKTRPREFFLPPRRDPQGKDESSAGH